MKKLNELKSTSTDRLLSPSEDPEIEFRRNYPGLSPKEALYVHLNKQTKNQERKDNDQNKLINAQSNEINKLNSFVKTMGSELQDFENLSIENDKEIERLKQLAGSLKAGGEERKETIKISDKQLQSLKADLDKLKNKPGADPEQLKALQTEIEKAKSGRASSDEISKLQQGLDALASEPRLNPADVQRTLQDIKKGYEGTAAAIGPELEKARRDLASTEEKFAKSLAQNREERAEYSKKYDSLRKDVFDTEEQVKKLTGLKDYIQDFIRELNQTTDAYFKAFSEKTKEVDSKVAKVDDLATEADYTVSELKKILSQIKLGRQQPEIERPKGTRDLKLIKGIGKGLETPSPRQRVRPEDSPPDLSAQDYDQEPGEDQYRLDFPDIEKFKNKRA